MILVDVKYRFIQESIKLGEIKVRYISTELNWADVHEGPCAKEAQGCLIF
jgi:hypothetical protein